MIVKRKNINNNGQSLRGNLFKGTLILTLAGFVTRIIGFFYRIFLSNTMGAEKLGIYQLVFPVYGICFTIYATGIQTSISRLVAAEIGKRNHKNVYKILRIGLLLSVVLALMLAIFVYLYSDYIARRFLLEPRSASSLRILATVFPFCGVTSCINGYYYGLKKAGVPASTQLLEQILRVIIVYTIAFYTGKGNIAVTCELAVLGIVIGEIASSLYNFFSLFVTKSPKELILFGPDPNAISTRKRVIIKDILSLSIPLSANRFLINILHSIEAVLIPTMLRRFGLSTSDALSIFGVLIGMSVPFILFPTALINALAVLLLPTVSEAQAVKNDKLIGKTTAVSIKYSLIIGIISTGIFIIFGKDLGNAIFHNEAAGTYLVILAWLCPFIYLTTTLGSIINGLGKAHITFINSVVGTLFKILLIVILIPRQGINGYLIALLVGQLIITVMDSFAVIKNIRFYFDSVNSLLKPGIIVALCGFLLKETYEYVIKISQIDEAVLILSFCILFCIACVGLFIITKAVTKKDFK
ncbi:polysaccharide biosynthesis protein [Mobilitalea sibirica]|uniref:Polysaccharide biosynthesis protein n=1 Tax=Mobilitalea sibirica TaxID=1462919 RepID=A0A8J7H1A2_9FIRM|nr:polysaccharide biosynthesis protein [Mobilitalea sibirica]MBH1940139.1 polysaccharide biosynthesis protein [Mobilitalea sibirica]